MINLKDKIIQLEEIIASLKKNIQFKDVYQSILYHQIIEQHARERDISITAEEIQIEADRQRYAKRLVRANETIAWLNDNLMTPEDWEAGIRDCLLTKKLANALFAKDVEKFFAENRLDFEQIIVYQIVVPYQQLAQEIFYQIEESEMSFYEAAHFYNTDEQRRRECGYAGKLYRWNFQPDVAAILFRSKIGEVVAPIRIEHTSHIFLIEELIFPELTSQRYEEILNRMFQTWLDSELTNMLHNLSLISSPIN
jgi:parvulin-like peptidyl-prolyl isomerase